MARRKLKLEDGLSISQVAIYLDRHPQTVWGWVRDGRMRATRIGSQWVIDKNDCYIPKMLKPGRKRIERIIY